MHKGAFLALNCSISFIINNAHMIWIFFQHDQRVDHLATTIESYMEEYNYTKDEACKKLLEMVENAWKTFNQELLLLTNIPLSLVRPIINLSQVIVLFYRDKDDYTHPQGTMRDNIKLVMLEPIFTKRGIQKYI
ncbi:hypothetical protein HPP92_023509 [Vanilla planifolia]|uniref:Terpene synthase metal-binding domain-containing protein n=1 Tax=Vanilla planifolia TaxID=51239 RepID=A0A835PKR0_VANPL|nr:hypothetical protein HPP92_023509 [Vanilla planifolia]